MGFCCGISDSEIPSRRWLLAIGIRPRPPGRLLQKIIEFTFATVLVLSVLPATVI
jgi:hypothetical protein